VVEHQRRIIAAMSSINKKKKIEMTNDNVLCMRAVLTSCPFIRLQVYNNNIPQQLAICSEYT